MQIIAGGEASATGTKKLGQERQLSEERFI